MAYRRAKCVELHEPQIVFCTAQAPLGRRPADWGAFRIPAEALKRLPRLFSIKVQASDDREGLPISRTYYDVQADVEIAWIECDVEGPNLIHLRIASRGKGETQGIPAVETITHGGSFTVWWEEDQQQDLEEVAAAAAPIVEAMNDQLTEAIGEPIEDADGDQV